MNLKKRYYSFIIVWFLSLNSWAGNNPISWQLSQPFQDPVYTGRTYTITYTLKNTLPFSLAKPIVITHNTSSQSEFTYDDQCTGKRLATQELCTVEVMFTPLVPGAKFFELVIAGYDNNQVRLPKLVTVAQSGVATGVYGLVLRNLPNQVPEGDSATYAFTFINNGQTTATNLAMQIAQTEGSPNIISNSCTGSLAAGGVCFVRGSFTPNSATPALQTVTANLSFNGPSASIASASTTTSVTAVSAGDIVGSLVPPNYLPPLMVQNTVYPVEFLFTNVSGSSVTLNTHSITCLDSNTVDCSSMLSGIATSCGIPSLPATAACTISATFTSPPATNPVTAYTISAELSYTGTGSPATVTTSGTTLANLPTARTVTMVNNCTFPVWFSLNGSAIPGQSCAAGCPAGTSCNSSTGSCYWDNYGPNTGSSYELAMSGGTNTVTIPVPSFASSGVQWSGNFSASTLCDGSSSCQQASCENNGGSTSCAPGKGFKQPATQAEITMNLTTEDSYDVEVINGFHIPISMAPEYYPGQAAQANNYTCGSPGASSAANGFGACNWAIAAPPAPNNGYFWVTTSTTSCDITSTSTQQCGGGTHCGLDANFNQVCGNFLGYWSANEVCSKSGISAAVSNYFRCSQTLPSNAAAPFPANSNLYSLMACSVPTGDTAPTFNSCYLSYPGYTSAQVNTCCGCVDWWNTAQTGGVAIAANSAAQSCTQSGAVSPQSDPQWTQYVQPMIQWMKAACPAAYTFPFDDKTSGFSCSNNLQGQPNSTSYVITFCDGNSGLPSGVNEGRAP